MAHNLSYITIGLLLHFLVIGTLLFVIFLKLYRDDLFHWMSAGFWAWGSMALYYLITPMIQHWGDPYYIQTRLAVTEGLSRMYWVTFCVAVGIAVFFLAYFLTKPGRPRFGLPQDSWPLGTWVVIVLALAGAAYSLVKFRGAYGFDAESVMIVGGKYVGDIIGYQQVMHMFAAFPIVLLILRRSTRILGYGLLGVYLVGRMQDVHDRSSAVSLVLAVTMVAAALRARKWPPLYWIALILGFTLLMHARGHVSFTRFYHSGMLTTQTFKEEIESGEGTSMLATLYLKTYLTDKAGYTYGAPLVSGLLFGPLPRKYFPWKDWLTDQFSVDLRKIRGAEMLSGAKHTVLGTLYEFGNIIAILLGMTLLGFLTRKLDGFLAPDAPMAVRAMGYVWVGAYYMMYGSSLTFVACQVYLPGIPFLGVVLCAKMFGRRAAAPQPFAPGRPLT